MSDFKIEKPKFTPGPWKVWDDEINSAKGLAICRVRAPYACESATHRRSPNKERQRIANASLIAAAPEMFDILNALVLLGKIDERHPAYTDVVSVIKKARGF